jgi:hypothetical protein
MNLPFKTTVTTGIIDWSGKSTQFVMNAYIDLDGTIKFHKFPTSGMWQFDGQFYYPPTPDVVEPWEGQA